MDRITKLYLLELIEEAVENIDEAFAHMNNCDRNLKMLMEDVTTRLGVARGIVIGDMRRTPRGGVRRYVINFLKENGPSTTKMMQMSAKSAGMNKHSVTRALDALLKKGQLARTKNGREYLWHLA